MLARILAIDKKIIRMTVVLCSKVFEMVKQ